MTEKSGLSNLKIFFAISIVPGRLNSGKIQMYSKLNFWRKITFEN